MRSYALEDIVDPSEAVSVDVTDGPHKLLEVLDALLEIHRQDKAQEHAR